MGRIAIVTDSTADLTPELAQAHDISIIPLNVHWGEETYLDGITLDIPTFYQMLQERKDFPMTSQPSVGDFMTFFQQVAERYEADTIVGVFLSSLLSGTMASAIQAKAELPDLRIELHDSRSVSMGVGFQALTAARANQAGASVEEILQAIAKVRSRMELLIALNTLEYLHRGGRIGGAARLLGTLLNFKPMLTMEGGKIDALGKARSRRKSLEALVAEVLKRLAGRPPAELAVMHTPGDPDIPLLLDMINEQIHPQEILTGFLSPVLGTHGGPSAIGLIFYTEGNGIGVYI
ncbi:MAG: DegV family protein [Anaerolineae bacterium]|nr:DegV family protein [Anaerolineae bacterium]